MVVVQTSTPPRSKGWFLAKLCVCVCVCVMHFFFVLPSFFCLFVLFVCCLCLCVFSCAFSFLGHWSFVGVDFFLFSFCVK